MSAGVDVLSPDAAAIYQVLAARGGLHPDDLAAESAVDPGSLDAALTELHAAGLVEVAPSGEVAIRVGEEAALHGLLSLQAESVTRSLLDARRALDLVLGVPDPQQPGLERVSDRRVLLTRLGDLMAAAEREVLNLHAGEVPTQQELDGAIDEDLELLRRGVAVHTVCPQHFVEQERWRTYVDLMGEHGAVTRFADGVPHRLLVFDRKVAVVPVLPHEPGAGAVFVREPAVVRALHQLAATILRGSRPLTEAVASTERPSDLDRRVLMLMSAGLTDSVSAGKLSVTERQFRRYVASVLERLGAQSRFQAGVKAVERGWL